MITFFTMPKGFCGDTAIRQRNAIQSWKAAVPDCEIILLGNDLGVAEAAQELGVRHEPDVQCNEFGTPLISSIFKKGPESAKFDVCAMIHTDIIIFPDFIKAVKLINEHFTAFLAIGQRCCLDFCETIDFTGDWQGLMRNEIRRNGQLDGMQALDFFVFSQGIWSDIPDFAIGRTCWDNWLIYQARKKDIPVVNISQSVVVVHQNHDYKHIKTNVEDARSSSRKNAGRGEKEKNKSIEFWQNRNLLGGIDKAFGTLEATHELDAFCIRPSQGKPGLKRRILSAIALNHPLLYRGVKSIRACVKRVGMNVQE